MSENNETTYVSLRNDLLFHMVFTRNEEALNGLLSVLLNIPEERLKEPNCLIRCSIRRQLTRSLRFST